MGRTWSGSEASSLSFVRRQWLKRHRNEVFVDPDVIFVHCKGLFGFAAVPSISQIIGLCCEHTHIYVHIYTRRMRLFLKQLKPLQQQ